MINCIFLTKRSVLLRKMRAINVESLQKKQRNFAMCDHLFVPNRQIFYNLQLKLSCIFLVPKSTQTIIFKAHDEFGRARELSFPQTGYVQTAFAKAGV